MNSVRKLLIIFIVTILAGCGGGGGGSSSPSLKAPVADLTGTWDVSVDGVSNCLGEATYHSNYSVDVVQDGNNLQVTAPAGVFNGQISGDAVSWSGSYPEDGGTTTITSMSLTVSADGLSLSGTSKWRWSDGVESCSGTDQSINAFFVPGSGPVPAAPDNLNATADSPSTIQLSWTDNANNELGFKLERRVAGSPTFSQIAMPDVDQTSYTDTGLDASTTYDYRIRAYNANGNSDFSATTSATTFSSVAGPAAPTNLTANAQSTDTIQLSWTDNADNETGYEVERSQSQSTGFSQIATPGVDATTYTDTSASPATTYYYRVRAVNNDANSNYSNTANATTPASPSAPTAPSGLTATASSSSTIELSWADNANNETGFKIERSLSQTTGFTQIGTTGADTTSYTSSGLSASTTYYYRVRAYNNVDNSSYSATAGATTLSAPVPASPSNVSVSNITDTSARLNWSDNSDNETGFEVGYCTGLTSAAGNGLIQCVSGFQTIAQVPANSTSYTFTGLSSSTSYSRFVRAYNSDGVSQNLGISFTTAASPPVLRLINDLQDQLDWAQWNQIIRVRIGSTENAVMTDTSLERLWPIDTASSSSTSHLSYVISPAYNQTTSYWDFDVSGFTAGNYSIYMQTGWWEYVVISTPAYWAKHMTQVYACDGVSSVYKWAVVNVTDHTSGTLEVKASDFLPDTQWYNSAFCP